MSGGLVCLAVYGWPAGNDRRWLPFLASKRMEILIIIDKLLSFYYNMTTVMTIVIYFGESR